jgi:hypothetical protein
MKLGIGGVVLAFIGCASSPEPSQPDWAVGTFHLAPEHNAPAWDTNLTLFEDGRFYYTTHNCEFAAYSEGIIGPIVGSGTIDVRADGDVLLVDDDYNDDRVFYWPRRSDHGCGFVSWEQPMICGDWVFSVGVTEDGPDGVLASALFQSEHVQRWNRGELCSKCVEGKTSGSPCTDPTDHFHTLNDPFLD